MEVLDGQDAGIIVVHTYSKKQAGSIKTSDEKVDTRSFSSQQADEISLEFCNTKSFDMFFKQHKDAEMNETTGIKSREIKPADYNIKNYMFKTLETKTTGSVISLAPSDEKKTLKDIMLYINTTKGKEEQYLYKTSSGDME